MVQKAEAPALVPTPPAARPVSTAPMHDWWHPLHFAYTSALQAPPFGGQRCAEGGRQCCLCGAWQCTALLPFHSRAVLICRTSTNVRLVYGTQAASLATLPAWRRSLLCRQRQRLRFCKLQGCASATIWCCKHQCPLPTRHAPATMPSPHQACLPGEGLRCRPCNRHCCTPPPHCSRVAAARFGRSASPP